MGVLASNLPEKKKDGAEAIEHALHYSCVMQK
jgi:hypothetical protein